ncbi:UNVERIFIED_CONTAM: hypothetical protein HDU68_009420 [Siphonaria sp. JEL0065]|nr:hypothetical protein HDU68_009420 [Siphonaria sp. JEL0065]
MGNGISQDHQYDPLSSGTSLPSHGYHILKVLPNSNASKAGLESHFDYIVAVNNTPTSKETPLLLATKAGLCEQIQIVVYSSKTRRLRTIVLDTDPGLGITCRSCALDRVGERTWHILDVLPNSPAEHAGLRAVTDYIVGLAAGEDDDMDGKGSVLHERDSLFELVEANIGRSIPLVVYSSVLDSLRVVDLAPRFDWGGSGCMGCDIGYGPLHRIPDPHPHTHEEHDHEHGRHDGHDHGSHEHSSHQHGSHGHSHDSNDNDEQASNGTSSSFHPHLLLLLDLLRQSQRLTDILMTAPVIIHMEVMEVMQVMKIMDILMKTTGSRMKIMGTLTGIHMEDIRQNTKTTAIHPTVMKDTSNMKNTKRMVIVMIMIPKEGAQGMIMTVINMRKQTENTNNMEDRVMQNTREEIIHMITETIVTITQFMKGSMSTSTRMGIRTGMKVMEESMVILMMLQ